MEETIPGRKPHSCAAGEDVVPASELAAAIKQINQLQRLLGKKTMEVEILKLPVESHMIYFLNTDTNVIIMRILIQHQDAVSHLNWQ